MYRILIVEDDSAIAEVMAKQIRLWDFDVRCVENFRDVEKEFTAYGPHLVLLDIMLPFYDGYYWCSRIRKRSKVPIVFLSSASDNMNIVMAMNMGGDDFIAKPFDLNVLIAKIQAVLRRVYDFAAEGETPAVPDRAQEGGSGFWDADALAGESGAGMMTPRLAHQDPGMMSPRLAHQGFDMMSPRLAHRGAVLDASDASLVYEGRRIELTKNEYRILQALLADKGRIVSRDKLMLKLWETDSFVDENTLTVNITRLRRKLEREGLSGFITTRKGLGYMIRE